MSNVSHIDYLKTVATTSYSEYKGIAWKGVTHTQKTSETHCHIYVSHIPNFSKLFQTFPEIKIFSKNILPKTFFETSHHNVCPILFTSGYQTYLGMWSSSLDRPQEVASYSVAYP